MQLRRTKLRMPSSGQHASVALHREWHCLPRERAYCSLELHHHRRAMPVSKRRPVQLQQRKVELLRGGLSGKQAAAERRLRFGLWAMHLRYGRGLGVRVHRRRLVLQLSVVEDSG